MTADYTKMQELAKAATHGKWHLSGPFDADKATNEPWFRVYAENTLYLEVRADCDGYVKGKNAANAAYIAAASPDAILALIAERDALAKDAARYRWLQDEAERDYIEFDAIWYESSSDLDAAIDTAMQEAK